MAEAISSRSEISLIFLRVAADVAIVHGYYGIFSDNVSAGNASASHHLKRDHHEPTRVAEFTANRMTPDRQEPQGHRSLGYQPGRTNPHLPPLALEELGPGPRSRSL